MRIHQYLEDMLGSKTRIATLRVLFHYPSKIFTGRELARLAKGASKSSVLRAIKDLESSGIVSTECHGRTLLIQLNCDHFIYENMSRLFREERKSFGKVKGKLKAMIPATAYCCLLFGSVARGEERSGSDVDLLLILRDARAKKKLEMELPTHLEDYELMLSWHIWSLSEFRKQRHTHLGKSIKRDAILIMGEDPWQQ